MTTCYIFRNADDMININMRCIEIKGDSKEHLSIMDD